MYRDNELDSTSIDICREKLEQLKTIFPEVFCEDEIDFDKLKLILGKLGNSVVSEKERFGLNWSGKADCFKIIQNPTAATLKPCREQSIDFDTTQNLFIEGDNLEVLKLLQRSYSNKVKMIYIDPPYNTGKDFIYPDDYTENLDTYLRYTEQKDEEGHRFATNTESDGRYHSKWLCMMYSRLYLAKSLLRDDGVIFISIDDHEQHHLRMICDQIFGEDNFVAQNIIVSAPAGTQSSVDIAQQHSYCLMYKKTDSYITNKIKLTHLELLKKYNEQDVIGNYYVERLWKRGIGGKKEDVPSLHFPLYYDVQLDKIYIDDEVTECPSLKKIIPYQTKSILGRWTWSKEKMKMERNKLIVRMVNGEYKLHKKIYMKDDKGSLPKSIISSDLGRTELGSLELKELFNNKVFEYPKYSEFIKFLIQFSTQKDDIIMDFFSGSSTTAHAVMKLNAEDGGNRKYIMAQLPEKCGKDSEAYKAGYKTIADIGKERIRRASKKISEEHPDYKGDLGFKVFKLDSSNFELWNNHTNSEEEYNRQLSLAVDNIKKDRSQEDILYDIILRLGLSLTDTIDVKNFGDKNVFSLRDGKILICLEKVITEKLIEEILKYNPEKVIFLDIGFQGNDLLKISAQHSFKNHISDNKNKAIEFIVY